MESLKRATVPIAKLAVAAYNPRKIGPKAMKALRKSMETFGMVQEIVVNRSSMRVVGGHQRLAVLKQMGEKTVPVVYVDLDEKHEKMLNVALNSAKIAGEWDDTIDDLLAELKKADATLYKELEMGALEAATTKGHRREGEVEFTEELMESHNYLVLYFDNEIDWLNLLTLYPLASVKALDSRPGFEKVGVGRVVRGVEFIRKLTEDRR